MNYCSKYQGQIIQALAVQARKEGYLEATAIQRPSGKRFNASGESRKRLLVARCLRYARQERALFMGG